MKKKNPPSPTEVSVADNLSEASFLPIDKPEDRNKAIAALGVACANQTPVSRSVGSDVFMNIGGNGISVRDGFDRRDYEDFRPGEAVPRRPKDIIRHCMEAYDQFGIIHNIIDLMSDFTVKGIDIVHPNKKIEAFYKEWFRKINGKERSERFSNLFYRTGNVIVHRQTAKLKLRQAEEMKRATATPDIEIPEEVPVEKREVPWRYNFINPLVVDILGEEIVPFIGPDSYLFAIQLPAAFVRRVRNPRSDAEKALVEGMPENIQKIIRAGGKSIPLDKDKTVCAYYKKDDWNAWAKPMMYSILADLKMLQKMKLTDLAAIDGAMSCIRVWKLGNIDKGIIPPAATVQRFSQMLANNVGGGVMDMVWTPDIELLETKTDVHQFLGDTKYGPILNAIFQGLGIPPTLSGNANPGGFTNNFISLKTLTERLQYGREMLMAFWATEIKLVQRAMEFKVPAVITFDNLLTDEAAEKQLLINMWDRGIISDEFIQDNIGAVPQIEVIRMRREKALRDKGALPPKASPFFNPQTKEALLNTFAQTGAYTPEQFGLELEAAAPTHSVAPMDAQTKMQVKIEKAKPKPVVQKGQPGQGRPLNKKDSQKRKKKVVKPRTKAETAEFIQNLAVAEHYQMQIHQLLSPVYLKSLAKKNFRELTDDEARQFESLKFYTLCQYKIGQEITKANITDLMNNDLMVPDYVTNLLSETIAEYVKANNKEPAIEVLRRFQAGVYALYRGDYGEETV